MYIYLYIYIFICLYIYKKALGVSIKWAIELLLPQPNDSTVDIQTTTLCSQKSDPINYNDEYKRGPVHINTETQMVNGLLYIENTK